MCTCTKVWYVVFISKSNKENGPESDTNCNAPRHVFCTVQCHTDKKCH